MIADLPRKGKDKMAQSRSVSEKILRVALYPRVSTEEQFLRGYSLQTQEEVLTQYSNNHGYKIVGVYRDEGHSARKPALKRKVMRSFWRTSRQEKSTGYCSLSWIGGFATSGSITKSRRFWKQTMLPGRPPWRTTTPLRRTAG